MITGHHLKAVKKRAQETTTVVQDTPQDIERMKITPTERGILICIRKVTRKATAVQMKAITKAQEWDDQKEPIEDCDYDVVICRGLQCKFGHHFTSPDACIVEWTDLLHDYTHEGKNYKKKLWDTMIPPTFETPTVHVSHDGMGHDNEGP
jgi:hypothetical protein